MHTPPRYSLVRRVLFPFSGEEQLSSRQSLRVIVAWAVVFTVPMLLCTLSAIAVAAPPFYKAALLLLGVVLGGVVVFGLSAWAIVAANNRSVLLRRRQLEKENGR